MRDRNPSDDQYLISVQYPTSTSIPEVWHTTSATRKVQKVLRIDDHSGATAVVVFGQPLNIVPEEKCLGTSATIAQASTIYPHVVHSLDRRSLERFHCCAGRPLIALSSFSYMTLPIMDHTTSAVPMSLLHPDSGTYNRDSCQMPPHDYVL